MSFAPAVYEDWVSHARFEPVRHAFRYRVSLLYLDLASRAEVFRAAPWFSDPGLPGEGALRELVCARTGAAPNGPIGVLTTPRTLGYAFNPISIYFCLGTDGVEPPTIVAEVTNTPWRERHWYVLPRTSALARGAALRYRTPKELHVSPFLPMDCEYAWEIEPPAARLRVAIESQREGRRIFAAALECERRPLDRAALRRMLVRNPFGALRTSAAIHWQAVRLWLLGAPFHAHPRVSRP